MLILQPMIRKMPVTTASLKKFNKTSEFVSNIENPESHEEVRDFLALCPFAIFKLKVGVYG